MTLGEEPLTDEELQSVREHGKSALSRTLVITIDHLKTENKRLRELLRKVLGHINEKEGHGDR